MKVNNYNISWSTIIINLTYWAGVIFVGISSPKPLLLIGAGSLIYSAIYGFRKTLE